jgi:hypothetical protein
MLYQPLKEQCLGKHSAASMELFLRIFLSPLEPVEEGI